MHTYCILLVHIGSSCADMLHINSVLCRPFADLMHTLSRANEFNQMPPERRGPVDPFFEGEGTEVAVLWPPPQTPTSQDLWAPGQRPLPGQDLGCDPPEPDLGLHRDDRKQCPFFREEGGLLHLRG